MINLGKKKCTHCKHEEMYTSHYVFVDLANSNSLHTIELVVMRVHKRWSHVQLSFPKKKGHMPKNLPQNEHVTIELVVVRVYHQELSNSRAQFI